ncbi:glycine zipper domain-containing protein [Oceanobacter kriegii]|uniref:glycine zipper domain-containing protein n=1 Tax=Oceanobacter kriegii TaxID=64972 RepID=UPI0003F7F247|nr:DUF883 family protein [Oceanobacter kriegii]
MANTARVQENTQAKKDVKEAAEQAADITESNVKKMQHAASHLYHQAHDVAESAASRSKEMGQVATTYARENPLKTAGMAFVAGALLSALIKRK